jgi:hypothetical protein
MHDYEKQLKNGLWLVKRGYVYYLYGSLDDIKRDDAEVGDNIHRLNNGVQVFNRCYDGCWIFRARKMSEVKEFAM